MRRKSERNKSKSSSEKRSSDATSKKTRRTSRRRKRSTSHSSSDDSDDAPLKPAVVEVATQEAEVSPPSVEPKVHGSHSDEVKQEEQPVWKVKTTEAPIGEIQKLKICLQRPPTTPERTEKSPRRRRGHASSQSDDASLTPEEKPHKRKIRRSSPTIQGSSLDNSVIEDAEKDECLTIVTETNEVIIGKGKLDCSQPSQETENEECVQDSRIEVQADESLIESKIEQDMEQDSVPVIKDVCEPQEQQIDDKAVAEQETVIETPIVKQLEITEEKQVETSECDIKLINDQPMEVQKIPEPEQTVVIRSREINKDKEADSKTEVIEKVIKIEKQITKDKQEVKVEQEQKIEDTTKLPGTSDPQIPETTSESTKEQKVELIESEKLLVKESKPVVEESVTEASESAPKAEVQENKPEIKAAFQQKEDESVETKLEVLYAEEKSEIISSDEKSEIVSALLESKIVPAEVKTKIEKVEIVILEEKSEIESSEKKLETVSSEEKSENKSSEEKSETVSSEKKIEELELSENEKPDEESETSSKEPEISSKESELSSKDDSTNEVEIIKTEEVKPENKENEDEELSSNEEDKMEESPVEENKSLEVKESSEKDMDSKPASPEIQMTSYEEKMEEDEPEKIIRTRNWGKYKATLIEEQPITFSVIQSLFPSVKILNLKDVKLETEESIKEPKVVKKEREVTVQSSSSPKEEDSEKEVSTIGLNRKISIVNDEASKLQPPPSPAKNPSSSVLYITNLVRPFTIKQLQELLSRTGKIIEDGFWTDRIKSKCYVQYETNEEAEATRNALHGVQWPTGNGKKLIIDFGTLESMAAAKHAIVEPAAKPVVEKAVEKVPEYKKEETITEESRWDKSRAAAPIREWDLGKIPQENRDRSRSRDRNQARSDRSDKKRLPRNESPSNGDHLTPRKKKKEDTEVKMMDDLFHKTKATPSIYWLPLSPEQIAKKQQQRLQRMAEHKRRMEESRRMERGFGRGGMRSRRRSARYDGD